MQQQSKCEVNEHEQRFCRGGGGYHNNTKINKNLDNTYLFIAIITTTNSYNN